ncbi:MAG: ankyrin repeat domain-containing protein [Akkermansiaceae bacterium]|nr:ankyrin repeat domain-containing protein [Akkermansiaceae bacterium]
MNRNDKLAERERLILWREQTGTVRDISPADGNLLSGTRDGLALVDNQWVYLVGFGEKSVRFNVADVTAPEIRWRTFESPFPDTAASTRLKGAPPWDSRLVSAGNWLLAWDSKGGGLLKHGETTLRPLAPMLDAVIAREAEERRKIFAPGKMLTSNSPLSVKKMERDIDPATLEQILDRFGLRLRSVAGATDGFWLLHSSGVSQWIPDEERIGTHGVVSRWILKDSPEGPNVYQNLGEMVQEMAFTDRHLVILDKGTRTSLVHLVDRATGRHLGALLFRSLVPAHLLAVGDECVVLGEKSDSVNAIWPLAPGIGFSVSEQAAKLSTSEPPAIAPRKAPTGKVWIPPNNAAQTGESPEDQVRKAFESGEADRIREVLGSPDLRRLALRDTHLIQTVESGDAKTLRLLLEAGGNPNAIGESSPLRQVKGEFRLARAPTLLMRAAKRGDRDMVALLVEFGASAPLRDEHFRNAFDYSPDESFREWFEELCADQIAADKLIPVLSAYFGIRSYWLAFPELKEPGKAVETLRDALVRNPNLVHVLLGDGDSILWKIVYADSWGGDSRREGTVLKTIPGLDLNAVDRLGRNFLARAFVREEWDNGGVPTFEFALKLGGNLDLEDRFGKSARDYFSEKLAAETEKRAGKPIGEHLTKLAELIEAWPKP